MPVAGRCLGSYVRSALWIVPFIALLLHVGVIRLVYAIDEAIGWCVSGTQMVLQAIISMTLTFLAFTFGSLLAQGLGAASVSLDDDPQISSPGVADNAERNLVHA